MSALSHAESRSYGDLEGRQRRNLLIGGSSVFLLVAMVVGTAAFVLSDKIDAAAPELATRTMSSTTRPVELFCAPADYRATCEATLSAALDTPDVSDHPRAAVVAAVAAIAAELARGFNRSSALLQAAGAAVARETAADCAMLLDDCRRDVVRSLAAVAERGVGRPEVAHDLQSWLSAVVTFQGSCVDMFPAGELRERAREAMRAAWEVSSNAIAVVRQVAALASMLSITGDDGDAAGAAGGRRQEHIPAWVQKQERRLLGAARLHGFRLAPNATVAKDGSGRFATISAALAAMPETYSGRYVIYVKEGVYEETVNVSRRMVNVTMYGDGSRKSIVTGSKNFVDGTRTWRTATFAVEGDQFMAVGLGFRNTAGAAKRQAVALRVKADRSIFLNCRVDGHQDTLFAQAYRQFYRGCVISGTVDFVFGDAAAVFQRCVLLARRPLPGQPAVVSAHGRRDRQQRTGFVLHRSRLVADGNASAVAGYLGRPWKDFARTVVMESFVGAFVRAEGYMPWEGRDGLGAAYYGEYGNVGPGAGVGGRATTRGVDVMSREKAEQFAVGRFLHGADWIPATGTPVRLGLFG